MLALAIGDEQPRVAGSITLPAGDSRVLGSFESRAGVRIAGWILGVGSLVAGSVMLITADPVDAFFVAGCVTLGVGVPVGFGMATVKDAPKDELARPPRQPLPVAGVTLRTAFRLPALDRACPRFRLVALR